MTQLDKQPDGTIKLTIDIPKDAIKKAWDAVIEEQVKTSNLPGFRKGKAPKKLVEEKLDKAKIQEEVLKKLLPHYYMKAIQEHSIRPILNPQIHVEKLEEGTDWQFSATTCEVPAVDLKDYKKSVQKITAKSKIIIPGKQAEEPKLDDILQAVIQNVDVKTPKILVDQEVDRLLSQMLDEVKRLGMSLDQYLSSTNKTPDQLRTDYATKAETDIKIEFTLQKIAENEKITVSEKEIEEALQKAKDENERKNLEANRYLLASILRQQKTLDFLKNL